MTGYTEKRRHIRQPQVKELSYTLSYLDIRELKTVSGKATTIDATDKGISIYTDFPVEKGHVLVLNTHSPANNDRCIAFVRWVDREDGRYKAGLEFV